MTSDLWYVGKVFANEPEKEKEWEGCAKLCSTESPISAIFFLVYKCDINLPSLTLLLSPTAYFSKFYRMHT